MKVAILTDTHTGSRNGSEAILDHQERFYRDIFFPSILEHSVGHILHLGDMFDKRKHTNTESLQRFRQHFIQPTLTLNIPVTVLAGNHDCYHRNTNEVNTVWEILNVYPNYDIIWAEPEIRQFGNRKVGLVPWMTDDNMQLSLEFIEKAHLQCQILAGHFEMAGFEMQRGYVMEKGLDPNMFWKYEQVWSGHYHTKSQKKNITYLGTSMQFTWSDANETKGFHIWDTETNTLDFIENPDVMFHTLTYRDEPIVYTEEQRFVKLFIESKTNDALYEQTLETIRKTNPVEFQVIDKRVSTNASVDLTVLKTGVDLLHEYVDGAVLDDTKKPKVKSLLEELYKETVDA